jgi:hypothetical protein
VIANDELERMWKEVVVVYLNVLPRMKGLKKPQSHKAVSGARFETWTSQI